MITNRVDWIYSKIKGGKNSTPFFSRSELAGRVYLIAANRAARRMLLSNTIQKEAKRMGATIEVDVVNEGEAPVVVIY
jgi:hypothetical protein